MFTIEQDYDILDLYLSWDDFLPLYAGRPPGQC